MSLVSGFVANHLISALESEFSSLKLPYQQALLSQVLSFTDQINCWVDKKLEGIEE